MPDDLAGRIGDGAVAVFELVPGEQRFADLSNYVLRGGASRFAPVVLDNEPIRYVLPVGIPGTKLDYGTLLIQRSRCALVWRTEPSRPYHALIMQLDSQTTVAQSAATIRGEAWGRFDLTHPGNADMTFLVPPVASTALPRMLYRVLVEEPGSRRVRSSGPELSAAVVEGNEPDVTAGEAPAPEVLAEESASAAVVGGVADTQIRSKAVGAVLVSDAVLDDTAVDLTATASRPVGGDAPTVTLGAVRPDAPAAQAPPTAQAPAVQAPQAAPAVPSTASDAPAPNGDRPTQVLPAASDTPPDSRPGDRPTQVLPAAPPPAAGPAGATPQTTWAPRGAEPAASGKAQARPGSEPLYRDEALYRDASRQTPDGVAPTQAGTGAAPALTRTAPTAAVPAVASEAAATPRQLSDGVKGFLTGLGATLVVGGLVVLAKVLGLLG